MTLRKLDCVAVMGWLAGFTWEGPPILAGVLLPLLIAASLTIPDPAGDARGDGGYILPQRPAVSQDALDLRSFTAEKHDKGMRFIVAYGHTANPWMAPSGFSAGVTDIFVKTGLGGQQVLADTGLRTRSGAGWHYHLRITGFGSTLERSTDAGQLEPLPAPSVTLEGTSLIIDAAVPPGSHAYWVTSSVYTPLSQSGLLLPSKSTEPTALQAGRANAPAPVDVLAPAEDKQVFSDDTLAPVGQTRDTATLILVGLGGLGLLVTVVSTVAVWRRLGRR